MLKSITDIEHDGLNTIVHYRIPGFQNFGAKLEEIASAYAEMVLQEHSADGVQPDALLPDLGGSDSDPQVAALRSELENRLKQLEALDPHLAGVMGATVRDMLSELDGAIASDDDDDDDDEFDDDFDGFGDDDEFEIERTPDTYQIFLEADEDWTKEHEARLNDFLAAWPTLRPKVLEAIFVYYREILADIESGIPPSPAERLVLPEAVDPSVLEDRISIHSLHFHPKSKKVGLELECLWDEENGIGVLLDGKKISDVGQADVSFY